MSFTVGGVDVADVHVGATSAVAVYLGADKVWPTAPAGYVDTITQYNPFVLSIQPDQALILAAGATWDWAFAAGDGAIVPDDPSPGLTSWLFGHGQPKANPLHLPAPPGNTWSIGGMYYMPDPMPTSTQGMLYVKSAHFALDHYQGAGLQHVWQRSYPKITPVPAGRWGLVVYAQTSVAGRLTLITDQGTQSVDWAPVQWTGVSDMDFWARGGDWTGPSAGWFGVPVYLDVAQCQDIYTAGMTGA